MVHFHHEYTITDRLAEALEASVDLLISQETMTDDAVDFIEYAHDLLISAKEDRARRLLQYEAIHGSGTIN